MTKTVEMCRAAEMTSEQLKEITADVMTAEIAEVRGVTPRSVPPNKKWLKNAAPTASGSKGNYAHNYAQEPRYANQHRQQQNSKCGNCPYSHNIGKCPAYGKKCLNCGKIGHFF